MLRPGLQTGTWRAKDGQEHRVAVVVGPEVGNVPSFLVEQAMRAAYKKGYDDLVVAGFGFGFGFDAMAQECIQDNKSAWEKLARALKGDNAEGAFEQLSSTTSLPFKPGPRGTVAVKVIDPRGNEVMRVHRVKNAG